MENEKNGVETTETNAPESQEVEKGVENASIPQAEEIDYKAELEAQLKKVTEERDNYKKGLLKAKGKVEDEMVDTDNLESIIEAKLEERLSKIQSSLTKNTIDSTLGELAVNPDERELIRFHYENSIVKSGMDPEAIRNDLENAKMIANKKSLLKATQEMAIAFKNKSQVSKSPAGASAEKNNSDPEYLSKEMVQKLKERGFHAAANDPKKVAEILKSMKGKL